MQELIIDVRYVYAPFQAYLAGNDVEAIYASAVKEILQAYRTLQSFICDAFCGTITPYIVRLVERTSH